MYKVSLKAARVNAGMTQPEAAERLKVTVQTLGSWERGKTSPKIDQIMAMCEMYGIPIDNLFCGRSSL